MNIDANDPKWTAYALGEITDEKEKAEIENILTESAEMRALVEEIRRTAGFLKEELQAEPVINLTQAQRDRIEEKAAGRRWFGFNPGWAVACAAAGIMLISYVVVRQLQHFNINTAKEPTAQIQPNTPATTPDQTLVQPVDKVQVATPAPKTNGQVAQVSRQVDKAIDPAKKEFADKSDAVISLEREKPSGVAMEGKKSQAANVGGDRRLATTISNTTTPTSDYLTRLPPLGTDVMDLINVLGGVIPPADNLVSANTQMLGGTQAPGVAVMRDGININEVRWDSGIQTPSRINPDLVQEIQVIQSSADAEYGREAEQVQVMPKKGGDARKSESKVGTTGTATTGTASTSYGGRGAGPGTGGGMGGFGGGGFAGGVPGGIPGGVVGGLLPSAPPPPPQPAMVGQLFGGGGRGGRGGMPAPGSGTIYNGNPSYNLQAQSQPSRIAPPIPPRPPDYRGTTWPPRPYSLGWFNTESYDHIRDNPFLTIDGERNATSTFSIDVDTASYSNMRRFIDNSQFPPIDAVRIEEFVNYFDYEYKAPKDGKPFAANLEITEAPWNPSHRLLRIALKGREITPGKRPNSSLVFLLDISGSMGDPNKLPLVKQSMEMLVDRLTESDRVAIVTYSTDASLYLPSTSGDQKTKLKYAIEQLQAGGSTNGAGGIQLAYRTAQENFIKGGTNRVILATDGDFNVGITDRGSLTRLIEEKAQSGIFLSALGYGMGNLKDSTLELLADKGRGNYAYINSLQEAQKVLVDQMDATLIAIAKDVKIQVEFNPRHVVAYRLIGYEDRVMAREDFNNDAKKAGVIGAGHAVTALYELVPPGEIVGSAPGVDPLKYQSQPRPKPSPAAGSDEVATVKIRSKDPEKDVSVLSEYTVKESESRFQKASVDFKFAASVAAFGMILRNSPYKGSADFVNVLDWANAGKGEDARGYRAEFIRLVSRARSMAF